MLKKQHNSNLFISFLSCSLKLPWCRGQASSPFEAWTRVRIPSGAFFILKMEKEKGGLTQSQGKKLLKLARNTIKYHFAGKELAYAPEHKEFKEARGVFVTLTKSGELRGCIGFPYPYKPLAGAIVEAAKAAAFQDPRFMPLRKEEFDKIKIEISVLTIPQELQARGQDILKEIKIGKDGLIIQFSGFSGLLLPQVALEFRWNELQFIEATCHKAGLTNNAWLNPQSRIYKFQAQIFSEEKKKRVKKTISIKEKPKKSK